MSRGLGSVQRAVLAGLANGPRTIEKLAGGIEAGGSYRSTRWESFRRAVASLRRAGLVIEHAKIYGTSRSVAYADKERGYRHYHWHVRTFALRPPGTTLDDDNTVTDVFGKVRDCIKVLRRVNECS